MGPLGHFLRLFPFFSFFFLLFIACSCELVGSLPGRRRVSLFFFFKFLFQRSEGATDFQESIQL